MRHNLYRMLSCIALLFGNAPARHRSRSVWRRMFVETGSDLLVSPAVLAAGGRTNPMEMDLDTTRHLRPLRAARNNRRTVGLGNLNVLGPLRRHPRTDTSRAEL